MSEFDNDFEQTLRQTMRAHDDEAPTAAEFRIRGAEHSKHPRARWLAPLAAAACVLAVIAVVTIVGVNRPSGPELPVAGPASSAAETGPQTKSAETGPPSTAVETEPLTCPSAYSQPTPPEEFWVPQQPEGIDGAGRLAPDEVPAHVVVCAFMGDDNGTLTGSRAITSGVDRVPAALAWLPSVPPRQDDNRACTDNLLPTDGDDYLLGLSYPRGTLWVSAPGHHCSGSSNGQFASTTNLRALADGAYRSGSWPAAPTDSDACSHSPGRLGQSAAMAPPGYESVQVCLRHHLNADQAAPGPTVNGDQAQKLADALNALRTEPFENALGCSQPGQLPDDYYRVIFRYPTGPAVTVEVVQGCPPELFNGSLQSAAGAGSVLPLITALAPGK